MMMTRSLATGVVSAGTLGEQSPEPTVCVCARLFGVFLWFWVCMDMESARSGAHAANEGLENDGCEKITVETTLALVKPDAVDRSEEIEDVILRSGFSVLRVSLLYRV